jgi:hypothetical protein
MFLLYVRLAFGHASMSRDPNSYRRQWAGFGSLVTCVVVPLFHSPRRALAAPPQSSPIPRTRGLVVAFSREPSACINSRALVLRLRPYRWVRRPPLDPPASTSINHLEDAKAVGRLPVQHHRAVTVITLHAPLLPPLFSSSFPRFLARPARRERGKNRGACELCSEKR